MEPERHGPQRHSGRSRQRAPQAALRAPGSADEAGATAKPGPQGVEEDARLDR